MATILILGAGVMATALAVPASDNGHRVILSGTPRDTEPVARMKAGQPHPKHDEPLPATVEVLAHDEVTPAHAAAADLIIVGVSSPGIDWAVGRLNALLNSQRKPVAFVTKGLARDGDKVATYVETVPPQVAGIADFIAIGGPCIARELALRFPTACVYACRNRDAAARAAALLQTGYYHLAVTEDVSGVEACAALKNFYAIGVSAMQTRYPDPTRPDGFSRNPTAAAFNQAVQELAHLCEALGGTRATAFDLAGCGDLHVTVGGGRNGRLGHGLGRGRTLRQLMAEELRGETVEGIDTAKAALPLYSVGSPSHARLPLANAIARAVIDGEPFAFALRPDRPFG